MRSFISLSLAAVISAQQLYSDAPTLSKNAQGSLVETMNIAEDRVFKTITTPLLDFSMDYSQQYDHITSLTQKIRSMKGQNSVEEAPIWTCSNREPLGKPTSAMNFLPVYVSTLSPSATTYSYTISKCFETIDFTFEPVDVQTFNVHVKTGKKTGLLCKEAFLFGNTEIFHIEVFAFSGNHTFQFKTPTLEAQTDANFGGIKVFEFCDDMAQSLESAYKTAKCFLGGLGKNPNVPIFGTHVPEYMEKANVEFLRESKGLNLVERTTKKIEYNPDLILDGDMLGVMRLDGLDQIIMYGTGASLGHNTMALRFDGELYIVESQAAWYWPTINLQRTKFDVWMKQAEDADFHVVHLPLRKEIRDNFDNQKAVDFFWETEGLPYGYHNFLYSWIDSTRSSLPGLLPNELLPIVASVVEILLPKQIFNTVDEALNYRLGTNDLDLDMAHIAAEAANQGMTVQEVMAMPEIDGWEYHGIEPRDGRSWVCSAYVAAFYKAAGLFGDMEINTTEFATADVYQLNFFDEDFVRPQACVDADPDLPYCQLLGKYHLELEKYNTVDPYDHMNESCGTFWPDYIREDGC